eukprot:COSAG01_NODE_379_length_17872_cov_8.030102_18_plen_78_part_00
MYLRSHTQTHVLLLGILPFCLFPHSCSGSSSTTTAPPRLLSVTRAAAKPNVIAILADDYVRLHAAVYGCCNQPIRPS